MKKNECLRRYIMKKNECLRSYFIWFVFALIIIPIGTVHAQKSPTLPKRVYFATGSQTSLAYQYAAGLSKVVTAHTPMLVVVQSMAGPAA